MSSGSESDEEYVPGKPEQLSEEDSADDETDLQYEKELEHKTKKRKAQTDPKSKGSAMKRTRMGKKEVKEEEPAINDIEKPTEGLDPEEEKKKEDDLWAKFLEGTDTKTKTALKKDDNLTEQRTTSNNDISNNSVSTQKEEIKTTDDSKERERRIFEFAGETIVVENNVIKEKIKTAESPISATASKFEGPSKGRNSGGLSEVLGQLNKKTKLSTLEKSKLDWVTYKKEKGLEEEIQNHNKGKKGYLDRQDFLERADHRQYEIERDLRMSRRSNR